MLKTIAQFPFISNLRANAVGVLRFSASAGHVILRKILQTKRNSSVPKKSRVFGKRKFFWQKIYFH